MNENLERIYRRLTDAEAARDEMQKIIIAFVLSAGGTIRLSYADIVALPSDATFVATFDGQYITIRVDNK